MDVFELRDDLIESYRRHATSFLAIKDDRVHEHVDAAFEAGKLWPLEVGLVGLSNKQVTHHVDQKTGSGQLPQVRSGYPVDPPNAPVTARPWLPMPPSHHYSPLPQPMVVGCGTAR